MELSEILYRDWLIHQISYGVDDLNDYIRSICYQVNKLSTELLFEKFNITSIRTIIGIYDKIDITKYGDFFKGSFRNCVLVNIEYKEHFYRIKLSSTSLMITGVKIDPIELTYYVARTLGLSILDIQTRMINCKSSLKTISPDDYINHPNGDSLD